ncbi:MAG: hypothetical protein KJ077_21975 [Anaerolineae bacterium]|nr:hypothetical protein [Anaerolineae bacterium]
MANGARDTLTILVEEMARLLLPLREAVASPARFVTFMARMGWQVNDIPPPLSNLGSSLDDVFNDLEKVLDGDLDPATIDRLRTSIVDVFKGIRAIASAPNATFPPHLIADNFKVEFPIQLVENLFADYLTQNHSGVAFALRVLGVMQIDYQPETGNRPAYMRYSFHFADLLKVIDDPGLIFRNAFGWGTDDFKADFLFDQIENLLITLDVAVTRDVFDPETAVKLEGGVPFPGDPEREVMTAVFFERQRPAGRLAAELRFLELPGDSATKPGFAVLPAFNGILGFRMQVAEDVALTIGASFDTQGGAGLTFRPGQSPQLLLGFEGDGDPTTAAGELKVKVELEDETSEPVPILGIRDGSRLEFRNASAIGGLALDVRNNRQELFLEAELQGGRLVIAPGQTDGFLQTILPANGIQASFELAVGFSNLRGFYFRGSGGVEIQIPTHLDLGAIEITALTVGLQPKDEKLPVNLGADLKTSLGPLKAVVENMGLAFIVAFPDSGGNLGPLDLDFGFKPPDGIGLTIDGGGFTGGGYLRYVEAEQRYEGMLELEYQNRIALKAIGLLTTRLPDGSSGFSLLIIITAEFNPPFELGLGFKLSTVGGLLGLNRTANAERLRTGLRDSTLNSVLFPQNVIENASRILSDLTQVFPAQTDRFIFGPMARITWGTPALLTIDLGLLIEIPDPVRVLILGVVRALLPDEEKRLLQLQVNFMGVIDFEAQRFAFDASLFDSKLLGYTLSGDMAVRLNWGAEPNFLLTVGGFHPAYQPPPLNLPSLRRLTLQLLGDNPRLTLETYFAVTSNTVQFGAKVELLAKAGSFSIYGFLSFDVLFQFNPFYFIASISAKLALRAGSSEIASISLDFTLEGPTPWHAKGTAKLKICWFLTIKVRFDKTFGEARNTRLDDILVLPLLQAALSDPGNWEAHLPDNRHLLVSFKQTETSSALVVYPFGILTIQQKVVPLQIEIQKFGSQRPADGNRFAIEQVLAGAVDDNPEELTTNDVGELFAPAQFFEMSDAQKLSSQSFERYDSGVKLVDSEALDGDYAVRRVVTYELFYIDEQRALLQQPEPHMPDLLAFEGWALSGAIANSPLSHARNGRSALAPEAVQVDQEAYAVVNASDLRLAEAGTLAASEAGAQRLMEGLIRGNPALEGEILVVPIFEVNQS